MQYNLIGSRINNHYVLDPYVSMLYLKRAYKFLKLLKDNEGEVIIVGNNHREINLENYFNKIQRKEICDLNTITNVTKTFDLLVCTDLALFYPYIKSVLIPKMLIADGNTFIKYKSFLHAFDYFIPLTNQKLDRHLHYVLARRYLS
ncbi:conserved Plasmodium protein, unknown function [Plasmodium knowlesi strain H]|uniref:Uncharacterized protein n=3 Tax=Plasmodium knowlesi TaxID=5850 RepID=A0A5K1U5G5_PLAKH|nr:uncharacterized protein PKNH_0732900 [Plasmodium knowlesi strain H]OTN67541.1 Uncharacterized protein PKNOH_S06435000 [Plasmodium knowlesi]CAA9987620.1 conserved protein, unknown function [Plasmodium knowlesi strain H]SBO26980.1 conserved Plasmodium protein, unknown function [Plasmodium knowlesi strain H]SBO29257.1 conserved Plasmodium protein, unknown function [Plasmodium knowlesi strain H]VVS77094.1 conserved protein, unknown function [Plasmodium knowlesi strain H]|eukprot:XP_002258620.1 [Plasmodium knowlesi strain H]